MRTKISGIGIAVFAFLNVSTAHALTEIKSIDFKWDGSASRLDIQADGPVTFNQEENTQDKQVILTIPGAKLGNFASRKLDASSFDGPVSLISPYMSPGKDDEVRIVIQLREDAVASVNSEGNSLVATFSKNGTSSSKTSNTASSDVPPPPEGSDAAQSNPGDDGSQDPIHTFLTARETKRFVGSPISLNMKDAELADIFRLIGETSGFNIVLSPRVTGKMTLSLTDVPWDQSLEIVLQMMRLGAERNGNVLRILPLTELTLEKQEELAARAAIEATATRVTRIFPINYANPASLIPILQSYLAAGSPRPVAAAGAAAPGAPASGGNIQLDPRTNSIIVYDLPANIDKMGKLISLLDTQTPQILIEAKVIEASENFSKNLSGNLGVRTRSTMGFSFNGGNPNTRLVGAAFGLPDAPFDSAGGGKISATPSISFLPGMNFLNALISAGEAESQVKVVTSPRSVVMNRESATIQQSSPILVPVQTVSNGVTTLTQSTVNAMVSLTVTPAVTNDENIVLDLNLQRDVPQQLEGGSAVAARSIRTKVVVENGNTLVIGGVYSNDTTKASSGVPFLRKIPLIGWFFGNESERTAKVELLFFVTPKILNADKSAFRPTLPQG